jgi:hypothetical protein
LQEFILHVDGQECRVMAGPSLRESHGLSSSLVAKFRLYDNIWRGDALGDFPG